MAKKKRAELAPADAAEAPGRETLHIPLGEPPAPEPPLPLRAEAPEASLGTVHMNVGVPEAEPRADQTVQMPAGEPSTLPPEAPPDHTLALPIAGTTPSAERTYTTRQLPESQLPPVRRHRPGLWITLGVAALLMGVGGAIYGLHPEWLGLAADAEADVAPPAETVRPAEPAPAPEPTVDVPPALRSYHEKALKGDANAMAVLGTMYFNGLNVAPNKPEGLKWLRKAAEAGNGAARKQLDQIEGRTPAQP